MHKLFNADSPIFRFLSTVFDFALLNMAVLLLCVPIVTAGAAITALYRMVFDYLNKLNENLSVRRLLREWVNCLKSATLPWIGFLLLVLLLMADMRLVGNMPNESLQIFFFGGVILTASIVLLTGAFFLPLLSQNLVSKYRLLLSRSMFRALALLPRMALILAFWLLPVALLIFLPQIFIALSALWLTGWISICELVSGKLILPYLKI